MLYFIAKMSKQTNGNEWKNTRKTWNPSHFHKICFDVCFSDSGRAPARGVVYNPVALSILTIILSLVVVWLLVRLRCERTTAQISWRIFRCAAKCTTLSIGFFFLFCFSFLFSFGMCCNIVCVVGIVAKLTIRNDINNTRSRAIHIFDA